MTAAHYAALTPVKAPAWLGRGVLGLVLSSRRTGPKR